VNAGTLSGAITNSGTIEATSNNADGILIQNGYYGIEGDINNSGTDEPQMNITNSGDISGLYSIFLNDA
jgi:hypothetical protein